MPVTHGVAGSSPVRTAVKPQSGAFFLKMTKDKTYSLENIIELTGDDGTLICEMIHMFISHAEAFKNDAVTAINNNDIILLKQKAHKFKTSAQLFQVMQLHFLLAKLENFNDFSSKEEIISLLKEIEELSEESVKQLKEELGNY